MNNANVKEYLMIKTITSIPWIHELNQKKLSMLTTISVVMEPFFRNHRFDIANKMHK